MGKQEEEEEKEKEAKYHKNKGKKKKKKKKKDKGKKQSTVTKEEKESKESKGSKESVASKDTNLKAKVSVPVIEEKKDIDTDAQSTEETESKIESNDDSKIKEHPQSPTLSMFRCVASECDYESTILLRYLHHWKSVHSKKKKKSSQSVISSIEKIKCPSCGHLNQSDYKMCSECKWDLRYRLVPEAKAIPSIKSTESSSKNNSNEKMNRKSSLDPNPPKSTDSKSKSQSSSKSTMQQISSPKSSVNDTWVSMAIQQSTTTTHSTQNSKESNGWNCSQCTLWNVSSKQKCTAC